MLVAWAAVLLLAGTIRADDFGPWSNEPRNPVMDNLPPEQPQSVLLYTKSPFTFAFRVWSEILTRIDGPRCAHQPSCSAYAHQALRRYGLVRGVWMALNRLMRGAHSSVLRTLPVVSGPRGVKYLDPLE